MTGYYLTILPWEFIKTIADFDPDYLGSFFFSQARIDPSRLLLKKIWPTADSWYVAHLKLPNILENLEPNLAGGTFLEFRLKLKTVILQVNALFFNLLKFG